MSLKSKSVITRRSLYVPSKDDESAGSICHTRGPATDYSE